MGGAHIRDVSGGQVTQIAGDQYLQQHYYQLVGDLPTVDARRAWTIPPPVRSFTGRDEQVAALRVQLTGQGAATLVPTAALYGMGGWARRSWRWPTHSATAQWTSSLRQDTSLEGRMSGWAASREVVEMRASS